MRNRMLEMHVVFSGQVQGVGFRYTAKRYAIELGLNGTVQNLPNGSVELIAQGSRSLLEKLVQLLDEEAFPQKITEKKIQFGEIASSFPDFRILNTSEQH